jgi:hypothetical protein
VQVQLHTFLTSALDDTQSSELGPQAPTALPQKKSTQYPLNRNVGGLQSQAGHSGEEKCLAPVKN